MIKLISINLNQAETRTARMERWKERGRWIFFTVLLTALITLTTLFTLLNIRLSGQISNRQATIEQVQTEIARLQRVGKNLSKPDILDLADLEAGRVLWAENLLVLGQETLNDMALTFVNFDHNRLLIGGIARIYPGEREFDAVNRFVQRLKAAEKFSDDFDRIKFGKFSRLTVRGQDIVALEVECELSTPPKPSQNLTVTGAGSSR